MPSPPRSACAAGGERSAGADRLGIVRAMDPAQHPDAFPELDDQQLELVAALGEERRLPAGTVLFEVGDAPYDWVVLRSGRVEMVRPDTDGHGEQTVITYGPRQFIGELIMITRQRPYVTCRVTEDADVIVV
ncbi:hypothetical protein B7486_70535, partial [cyanobacterium TDX16]